MRRKGIAAALSVGALGILAPAALAERPGPGTQTCSPGQNNIGGGGGNSGPGDKQGAPLKAPDKFCPGSG